MLAQRAEERRGAPSAVPTPARQAPRREARGRRAQQDGRVPVGHQAPPGRGRGGGEIGHAHGRHGLGRQIVRGVLGSLFGGRKR
jgi:hypothetical protein